MKTLHVRPSRF